MPKRFVPPPRLPQPFEIPRFTSNPASTRNPRPGHDVANSPPAQANDDAKTQRTWFAVPTTGGGPNHSPPAGGCCRETKNCLKAARRTHQLQRRNIILPTPANPPWAESPASCAALSRCTPPRATSTFPARNHAISFGELHSVSTISYSSARQSVETLAREQFRCSRRSLIRRSEMPSA
jgi:hypothetical protein